MSPVPLARHKSGPSNETAKTKAQCHNRPSASLQPFTSNCDVSISKREVKQCPNEQSIHYIMTGDGLRSSLICKQGQTIECNNLLSQQMRIQINDALFSEFIRTYRYFLSHGFWSIHKTRINCIVLYCQISILDWYTFFLKLLMVVY